MIPSFWEMMFDFVDSTCNATDHWICAHYNRAYSKLVGWLYDRMDGVR